MTANLENEFHRYARPAGLIYLCLISFGIAAEFALRGPLIDWRDSAATATALRQQAALLRLSMAGDMLMALCDVVLAVLLYRMLRPVDEVLALMAMLFRLLQMALVASSLLYLFQLDALLSSGGDPLPLLHQHAAGYDLGLLFFGANTMLIAVLLCRSRVAPMPLVALILTAGLVYLLGSLSRFVAPDLNAALQPAYLVPFLAETALALWLCLAANRVGQPQPA